MPSTLGSIARARLRDRAVCGALPLRAAMIRPN